jgi:hypothetical protein
VVTMVLDFRVCPNSHVKITASEDIGFYAYLAGKYYVVDVVLLFDGIPSVILHREFVGYVV